MAIKLVLGETIERSEGALTRNNISVHSQVRSNTLSDLANGDSKSIKFETLARILDAMNTLDETRTYGISDIIEYETKKER